MSRGDTVQTARANGARDSNDVAWDQIRTPYQKNGSTYALLPNWAARDIGLTDDKAQYIPGYSPAGQTVIIEEAAIIIRIPTEAENNE